jgi:hypothetical protein
MNTTTTSKCTSQTSNAWWTSRTLAIRSWLTSPTSHPQNWETRPPYKRSNRKQCASQHEQGRRICPEHTMVAPHPSLKEKWQQAFLKNRTEQSWPPKATVLDFTPNPTWIVHHWPHPRDYSIFTFPNGWNPKKGSLWNSQYPVGEEKHYAQFSQTILHNQHIFLHPNTSEHATMHCLQEWINGPRDIKPHTALSSLSRLVAGWSPSTSAPIWTVTLKMELQETYYSGPHAQEFKVCSP